MVASTVLLLDPTAKAKAPASRLADRPGDIRGATVGFVDNGWWSLSVVLNRYRQLLAERFGITEIVHYKKKPGSPSPDKVIDELAAKCQAVIVGLGH